MRLIVLSRKVETRLLPIRVFEESPPQLVDNEGRDVKLAALPDELPEARASDAVSRRELVTAVEQEVRIEVDAAGQGQPGANSRTVTGTVSERRSREDAGPHG